MRRRLEWFRFRLPREVWRVVIVPRLFSETGKELYGVCDYDRRTIKLSAAQPVDELCNTLIHELLHCAGAGHASNLFDSDHEERFILACEPRLWAIVSQLGFRPPLLPVGWERMHALAMEARHQ